MRLFPDNFGFLSCYIDKAHRAVIFAIAQLSRFSLIITDKLILSGIYLYTNVH